MDAASKLAHVRFLGAVLLFVASRIGKSGGIEASEAFEEADRFIECAKKQGIDVVRQFGG